MSHRGRASLAVFNLVCAWSCDSCAVLSGVQLFATPWTVALQAPLSMGFSITQSCLTLCDAMDCSRPGFPVHHPLPEYTQTNFYFSEVQEAAGSAFGAQGSQISPGHPVRGVSAVTGPWRDPPDRGQMKRGVDGKAVGVGHSGELGQVELE